MGLKDALSSISPDSLAEGVKAAYDKWHMGPQSPEVYEDLQRIVKDYEGLFGAPNVLEDILRDTQASLDDIESMIWGARLIIVALVETAETAELPSIAD